MQYLNTYSYILLFSFCTEYAVSKKKNTYCYIFTCGLIEHPIHGLVPYLSKISLVV